MCYQVVEVFTVCRCPYYRHAVDPCVCIGTKDHGVQEKVVLVGYICEAHKMDMIAAINAAEAEEAHAHAHAHAHAPDSDCSSSASQSDSISGQLIPAAHPKPQTQQQHFSLLSYGLSSGHLHRTDVRIIE